MKECLLWDMLVLPRACRGCPPCSATFLCCSHPVGGFPHAKTSAETSSCSIFKLPANNHRTQLQRTGHELVCLVPKWTDTCLQAVPGQALTHVLRVFYSADIGIATASSCDGPTCFVPELVAGSASVSLTHPIFLFSRQLAMCQHSASHYCNTILRHAYAYDTHAHLPTYFAMSLSYTLIPTFQIKL